MIKKLLILTLCCFIPGCGGGTFVAGLKFKKEVGAETNPGNPGFTSDVVKLKSGKFIGFERPIGKCGAGVTFFGIILPIVPVWANLNSCEKGFEVNISGLEVSKAMLRYNNVTYNPISVEILAEPYKTKYEYGRKFKFKMDDFQEFRFANDKLIIVTAKAKDGTEFTQELQ